MEQPSIVSMSAIERRHAQARMACQNCGKRSVKNKQYPDRTNNPALTVVLCEECDRNIG